MDGLVLLGFVVVGLVLVGSLAIRVGVDSRIDSDDTRRTEAGLTV